MKKVLSLYFILMCILELSAQVKSLSYELSSNKVSDISIQENGLTWIGTDEGLNVFYDNEKQVYYSSLEDSLSLLNSKINKLFNSSDEDLFVLSQGGVSIFNRSSQNFKQIPMLSAPVSIIENNQKKEFWIATEKSGFYHLNDSFEVIGHYVFDPLNPLSISTSNLNYVDEFSLIYGKDSLTYIASNNGLNVFDDKLKTFKRYFKGDKTKLSTNRLLGMYNLDENILLVSINELVNYNISKKTFTLLKKPESEIQGILKLDETSLLVQTSGQIIQIDINEKKEIIIRDERKDKLLFDKSLNFGKNKVLWEKGKTQLLKTDNNLNSINEFNIGSTINNVKVFNNSVYIATTNGIKTLLSSDAIVNKIPISSPADYFYIESEDILFFKDNKVLKYSSVNDKFPLESKTYDRNFSQDVFETSNSFIILGNKNIALYDIKKNRLVSTPINEAELENNSIQNLKLIEDKLYAGFDNGIIEINFKKLLEDEAELTIYEYNELLNKNIPRGFYDIEKIDSQLFVTEPLKGMSQFDENFSSLKRQFNYNGNSNISLAASTPTKLYYNEKDNNLYVATLGNGLFRYDLKNQTFNNYSTADGLLSNNIYDFILTNDRLYFQSGKGINYFEDDIIKNINEEDGLGVTSFLSESLHSLDEKIIVAGKKTQEIFSTKEIEKKDKSFTISLFKTIGIDELNTSKTIPLANNKITIDHSIKTILLDLIPSEQYKSQQIQYFLEKEGGSVIQNGFNNQIQLNALPYYTSNISVYAINGEGQRSSNDLMLEIYNAPPWWLRVETIFGYLIFLIVSIRAFVNYREKKTKERMEGERKNQELEEAKQLQNSLLPKENPAVNGFDISTYLKPATEIGGDYYDFFYEEGEYFYAICGDATGHGVVSGIMVSVTKAGLNGIPMGEPSTILQQLNRIVKRVNFGRLRMSLSVAQFNENKFKISSAAMPPTYYFSARNNNIEEILVPNLPLGGIESEKFDGVEKDFHPGDVMVMISDGLPELPNKGNDLLDYPLVFSCIKDNAKKSAGEIKDALVELSDEWAEGLMNPDDITIVVIKKAA